MTSGERKATRDRLRLVAAERGIAAEEVAAPNLGRDWPSSVSKHSAKHAAAFRRLEGDICDCAMMAKISASMMGDDNNSQYPQELVFAVMHTNDMIAHLKKTYYAHYSSDDG